VGRHQGHGLPMPNSQIDPVTSSGHLCVGSVISDIVLREMLGESLSLVAQTGLSPTPHPAADAFLLSTARRSRRRGGAFAPRGGGPVSIGSPACT
jgi:hypothetical protein